MILQQEQIRLNYIEEISIKSAGKKKEIVQISKNLLPYIIVSTFRKVPGHDHTLLTNECQRKYDSIMSKYVTQN